MNFEIEFELSATQYQRMGYPGLKLGEILTLTLDAGVLLPDLAAESWYTVQQEPWPARFERVGAATYAFSGQIIRSDWQRDEEAETTAVLLSCGAVTLRATCAPQEDGRLPFGVWEPRSLAGIGRLQGIVEDDFTSPIGQSVDVTIWGFHRLVLTPGDPVFGQWHESDHLAPTPYTYDRVVVVARLHRQKVDLQEFRG